MSVAVHRRFMIEFQLSQNLVRKDMLGDFELQVSHTVEQDPCEDSLSNT